MDIDEQLGLPVRHQVGLAGGGRMVTALGLDPAGARLAVGAADYSLRLYDFNGMKGDLQPFRELVPHDG